MQEMANHKSVDVQKNHAAGLREMLQDKLAELKADFFQTGNISRLFKQHCRVMDALLRALWLQTIPDSKACLIAVGGYGRGELYPYSDIDLLILVPNAKHGGTNELNSAIEKLVGLLWDIGLNIGHSVRTLDECIDEAAKDITVQTNLLEARFLAGDADEFRKFTDKTSQIADPLTFFHEKVKEQDQRHAKFNDTAYNLEPNIKESPGGLRDLHMILWLARSLPIDDQVHKKSETIWETLTRHQIVSPDEAKLILQHQRKLQTLRIHLHFMSKRREDRLLFDFQNDIALTLNYRNTAKKRASEQLMQSYYRSVKFISVMNEILLKLFRQMLQLEQTASEVINDDFYIRNQLLECADQSLFEKRPTAIFEAFLLWQQRPALKGMSAALIRNLQRAKHCVNKDFRNDTVNKKCFIEILSQPIGVNHTLRAMNRYGILGSYIPAFGRIVGQMQHDLFHVYTVDEHILNVLANLRRFSKQELKHEFPRCSQLFSEFDAPYLLYLAALFHDIAKGRGGDHSELGKTDAARFCKQHNLSKDDGELVAWLVENHLKMSSTAQKSDLSDPAVIESFAALATNQRRLTALYLLTVADIRGTSPAVWNAWKARLLENLYDQTQRALADPAFHIRQMVSRRIEEASEKLIKYGISRSTFENMWQEFGSNYFVRHDTDEIAWQSRLLTPHLRTATPIVRARLSPYGDGIEVMIYTKDQNDIFARICNFFDRMGYNIVAAKIYTTSNAYALDSFIILDQNNRAISYSGLLKFIETNLTEKLQSDNRLESPLTGRVSRQVKHMPIQVQVLINEDTENHCYTLDIITNDRPGLLATVAQQFIKNEIELHHAKINTLGNRVEDTFLISAKNMAKLSEKQIEQLRQSLIENI